MLGTEHLEGVGLRHERGQEPCIVCCIVWGHDRTAEEKEENLSVGERTMSSAAFGSEELNEDGLPCTDAKEGIASVSAARAISVCHRDLMRSKHRSLLRKDVKKCFVPLVCTYVSTGDEKDWHVVPRDTQNSLDE